MPFYKICYEILANTDTVVVQYVYGAWSVGLVLDANGNEITSLLWE